MLEQYKVAVGRDLIPKSGPIEGEKVYLERARMFYKMQMENEQHNIEDCESDFVT